MVPDRLLAPMLAVALGLPVGLVARDAGACKCSYTGTPISAPNIRGGALELREEAVALRCDRGPPQYLACTWRARYRLHNPGEAQTFELGVGHVVGARVELALDGVVVTRAALDARGQRRAAAKEEATETRASWTAAAAEEVTLTVDASFLLAPWSCPCGAPTNHRRHPWVSRWAQDDYFVNYAPGGAFSAAPETMTVMHDIPARWHGDRHLKYRREGRRKVADNIRRRPTSDRWDEDARFSVERPLRLEPGGPVLAAGLGWSPEGLRPRLRAGWELAWPKLLAHSLVVETDARRRVMVVPAWELTIPHWLIFLPDLGAGLGVPVQVLPEARPGVRVHGTFGFWIFHLIGSFDHFPAVRGLPREHLGALMLQVGF